MTKAKEKGTGAKRQAAYAERQRALGRRQRSFWLTDEEYQDLVERIEQLRQDRSSEEEEGGHKT